ncbi:hypothetical protein PG985_015999 [Apiospora marii]|uniref:Uncharacterized protein n=1 Tax=Apiospora marii TaxID=335849 RepID=A0ABR1S3U3_9PEZI
MAWPNLAWTGAAVSQVWIGPLAHSPLEQLSASGSRPGVRGQYPRGPAKLAAARSSSVSRPHGIPSRYPGAGSRPNFCSGAGLASHSYHVRERET